MQKKNAVCQKCGTTNTTKTEQIRATSAPTFEAGQATAYDDRRDTEYEWTCECGNKFWAAAPD